MWGLKFEIDRAEGVRASIPGWLLNAAATHTMLRYMDEISVELSRDPEAYGHDPARSLTLFVQTWDRALSGVRSLAFGRRTVGQDAVLLIPDVYYLDHRGYANLRRDAEGLPVWSDRKPKVGWRGSITGQGRFDTVQDIPRVRMALLCRDLPSADVRIFDVHETMRDIFDPARIATFISDHDLVGERWHMSEFGQYRYALDIDGHANAWGFLEKMILGCCVLKVQSPYEQWFYGHLQPWVHYVPVKADMSDLVEKIGWCAAHDAECEAIARNGHTIANMMNYDRQLADSCRKVVMAGATIG